MGEIGLFECVQVKKRVVELWVLLARALVDLIDHGLSRAAGSSTSAGGTREASGEATRGTTSSLVHLGDDGVADLLDLLLLGLVLLLVGRGGEVIDPLDGLVDDVVDGLLVVLRELGGNLVVVDGVADVVDVVLESVLGLDLLALGIIVGLEALGIADHALNVVLGETTLVVGDGDAVDLTGGLVLSRDVEDTVGINVEGDLDLGDTTGGRGDTSELELT